KSERGAWLPRLYSSKSAPRDVSLVQAKRCFALRRILDHNEERRDFSENFHFLMRQPRAYRVLEEVESAFKCSPAFECTRRPGRNRNVPMAAQSSRKQQSHTDNADETDSRR